MVLIHENLTEQLCGDPLPEVLEQLMVLYNEVNEHALQRLSKFRVYYPDGRFNQSALNLGHYLAFRRYDLRDLQIRLARQGLSSLGRAEACVMPCLESLILLLCRAVSVAPPFVLPSRIADLNGNEILTANTLALFGGYHAEQIGHVMVTMDSAVACSPQHIRALLSHGMTCARINCAHDDLSIWANMVKTIRQVEAETGKNCKILFDLAGHKIRTGEIQKGPEILRLKAKKDTLGKLIQSAKLIIYPEQIQFIASQASETRNIPRVSAPPELLRELAPGQILHILDARNKRRQLIVEHLIGPQQWILTTTKTIYLPSNCEVKLTEISNEESATFRLGPVASITLAIKVFKGDLIILSNDAIDGKPAVYDHNGLTLEPVQLSCTLRKVTERLEVGHSVWIDDGKIGAVVENIDVKGAWLRITHAKTTGSLIKPDKGMNFPDTLLDLPALSNKDLDDLANICQYADLIGFSFVESIADIDFLIEQLRQNSALNLPIIAKIETNRAVKNLPNIILGTIGRHRLGIMIARGDLSVELGSARLTEIQEEIMWLCEAAHIPVIWATQVLETIAKKGGRSRAEFTDAGMATRAECVMLNKGPYILDALDALIHVMTLMKEHQHKKFSRLRALHW